MPNSTFDRTLARMTRAAGQRDVDGRDGRERPGHNGGGNGPRLASHGRAACCGAARCRDAATPGEDRADRVLGCIRAPYTEAFRQELRELGYVEGKNIAIEYRWADFKPDRASALAAELVRLNVDVIVSTGGPVSAHAAKRATKTIPIVFEASNPVGSGLVPRLDRPGGNMTGSTTFCRN